LLKENKFAVIFFLFLFFSAVHGKIYYIEAYMEISPKGDVIINYTIISKNVSNVKIFIEEPGKFILPENCKRIEKEIIKCRLEKEKTIFSEISHVEKYKKGFTFEKNIRVFDVVERSVFLVKLPEGALLPENQTKFFPLYGTIATDGRRIFVIWERKNLQEGEIQGVKIFYEFPPKKQSFALFSIALFLFLLSAIGFALWFILWRKKKRVRDIILPVLKEDEKKIMEIILRYPKGVNQKIIVKESNYSKGKVSKVLKSLAERGLVRLERRGRTNIVYPIFEVKKK